MELIMLDLKIDKNSIWIKRLPRIKSEEIPKYCSNSVIFSAMQDPVIQAALSIVALPSNVLVIQWAVKLIRDSLLMQVNWSLKYLNPVIIYYDGINWWRQSLYTSRSHKMVYLNEQSVFEN